MAAVATWIHVSGHEVGLLLCLAGVAEAKSATGTLDLTVALTMSVTDPNRFFRGTCQKFYDRIEQLTTPHAEKPQTPSQETP